MPKQIIIDYDEYLELDRIRDAFTDLKIEFEYNLQLTDDPVTKDIIGQIELPRRLKDLFGGYLHYNGITKLIMTDKDHTEPKLTI